MRNLLTSIVTAAATVVATPALAQTATWNIDSAHSTAGFAVRHMMVTTVRGDFGKMTGTVQFDGKDVKSVGADVTVDVASVNTHEPKRDEHLKSPDFFDAAKFPTMTFRSKRVEASAAGAFKLVGDLTMRGVTREVTFDVEGPTAEIKDQRGNTRVGATATARINRQDFGVSWSRTLDAGGLVVSNDVTITIDLALVKAAATSH